MQKRKNKKNIVAPVSSKLVAGKNVQPKYLLLKTFLVIVVVSTAAFGYVYSQRQSASINEIGAGQIAVIAPTSVPSPTSTTLEGTVKRSNLEGAAGYYLNSYKLIPKSVSRMPGMSSSKYSQEVKKNALPQYEGKLVRVVGKIIEASKNTPAVGIPTSRRPDSFKIESIEPIASLTMSPTPIPSVVSIPSASPIIPPSPRACANETGTCMGTQNTCVSYSDSCMKEDSCLSPVTPCVIGESFVPIRHYLFNDMRADMSLVDSTGNRNGVINVNSSALTTAGKINSALNFQDKYAYIASPGLPINDFTYSFWIYPTAISSEAILMASGVSINNELLFMISDGKFQVHIHTPSSTPSMTANTTISANNWYHIAVTRTNGIVNVYINNTLDKSVTLDRAFNFGTCGLYVGVDADSGCTGSLGNYFNGKIDDLRIYSTGLSATQISTIYSSGNGTESTTLVSN